MGTIHRTKAAAVRGFSLSTLAAKPTAGQRAVQEGLFRADFGSNRNRLDVRDASNAALAEPVRGGDARDSMAYLKSAFSRHP